MIRHGAIEKLQSIGRRQLHSYIRSVINSQSKSTIDDTDIDSSEFTTRKCQHEVYCIHSSRLRRISAVNRQIKKKKSV